MHRSISCCVRISSVAVLVFLTASLGSDVYAEKDGKLQILLMGDSTCIGSVCRRTDPKGPHLEDVVREQLAAQQGLPSADVINQGRDGEFVHSLLSSKRYDRDIAKLVGVDYILIRYGINDRNKREDFAENFPADYKKLLSRLRIDHPKAQIVLITIIPYMGKERDEEVNSIVRKLAEAENLPVLDMHSRYAAELKHGFNMLNYRRVPLDRVPERFHGLLADARHGNQVIVMDNRLDAHLRDVPGWFTDRHPNLAGYHVIGDETANYLIPLIRKQAKAAAK